MTRLAQPVSLGRRDRAINLSWLIPAERVLVVLCLLLFSEGLLSRILATPENPEGGTLLRMLWFPVYAYIAVAAVFLITPLSRIALRAPMLVALSAMAIASMVWSILPDTSLRRGIAIFFTTGFGLYLAARFSWRDALRLFAYTWLILAAGSFVAALASPSFGIMSEIHVGAWRGLWWEKNTLGGHMARAAFLFMLLLAVDKERRKVWAAGLFLSSALVLLSTSKTSLLGLMLGMGLLCFAAITRKGAVVTLSVVWIGFALAAGAILTLIIAPEAVFQILGRDLTLTGRTDIWAALGAAIEDEYWLGYGYGSFWIEERGPAFEIREATEWEVPTAHNGIIELWLAVGLIGVLLFLADYMVTLFRGGMQALTRPSGLFAVGSVILFALFSVSESIIMQQNNITWVTYAFISGKLALDASDRSRTPRRGTHVETSARPTGPVRLRGRQIAARP